MKDKSNKDIDLKTWKQEFVQGGIPLQKNTWDCGMFMLKYIDFNSRGLDLMFVQVSEPLVTFIKIVVCMRSSFITQLPSL